jgi:hypothetical protein
VAGGGRGDAGRGPSAIFMLRYTFAERRVPKGHPLRAIRVMADMALTDLGPRCARTRSDYRAVSDLRPRPPYAPWETP